MIHEINPQRAKSTLLMLIARYKNKNNKWGGKKAIRSSLFISQLSIFQPGLTPWGTNPRACLCKPRPHRPSGRAVIGQTLGHVTTDWPPPTGWRAAGPTGRLRRAVGRPFCCLGWCSQLLWARRKASCLTCRERVKIILFWFSYTG